MKRLIIWIVILAVVGSGGFFGYKFVKGKISGGNADNLPQEMGSRSPAKPEAIAEIASYKYTEEYSHPVYNFSFKYPKDFKVSEIPMDIGDSIVVQNTEKGIGVQILITPFEGGEDIDVTSEVILEDLPDVQIGEPQEVLIGKDRKGLAFKSNNEAFGGNAREVWFVFKGNLYQITTYAELDGFLQGLFGTWKFLQ